MKKILSVCILLGLSIQTVNAKEINKENKIDNQQNQVMKKMTTIDEVKVLLDEKDRLKKIEKRRLDTNKTDLNYLYVDSLKYDKQTKGLMREAIYYMNYIEKNYNNKDMLKKELYNIHWNSICMNERFKDGIDVVYNILQMSTFSDQDSFSRFEKGSKTVSDLMYSNIKPYNQEEVKIRCFDVYGK